jgi:DNA helicase-2/ATP-dependent DNA helicase PcrA
MDTTVYIEILQASNKYEDQARIENLQELKSSIIQFLATSEEKTLTAYLETITLDRTEDNLDYGKISLMTIHAAKGLEFDHVFVVGLEESMFPSGQSLGEGVERLEEERRLFYVAVTRARKELNLLYAKSRLLYGKLVNNPVSRFIGELPKNYISRFRV